MKETDRIIYNRIKETKDKIIEVEHQAVTLNNHLYEINIEASEIKDQITLCETMIDYYNQFIENLKSLLIEEYDSIKKEMEEKEQPSVEEEVWKI